MSSANFDQFASALHAEGMETRLMLAGEAGEPERLFVPFDPDAKGRERYLEMSFAQGLEGELEEGFALLNFFAYLPFPVQEQSRVQVEQLLWRLNNRMPVGHFSLYEDRAFFRYVLLLDLRQKSKARLVVEIVYLSEFLLNQYSHFIESVSCGEKSLSQVLQEGHI